MYIVLHLDEPAGESLPATTVAALLCRNRFEFLHTVDEKNRHQDATVEDGTDNFVLYYKLELT
jgi:hypothetical protein